MRQKGRETGRQEGKEEGRDRRSKVGEVARWAERGKGDVKAQMDLQMNVCTDACLHDR